MCMSVYMMCVSVVSKQPVGKSLKDEGNLQILHMRDSPHRAFLILLRLVGYEVSLVMLG